MTQPHGDHPHTNPNDGRTECLVCGKWVHQVIHSCKGVPVTPAAEDRYEAAMMAGLTIEEWRRTDPSYAVMARLRER